VLHPASALQSHLYALLESARQQGRSSLICIELDLNEAEGLQWLLWKSRRSNGLNAFSRILLARELEPWFKKKALANQQAGGGNKGSSKLTEAERVDVRSEVASAAGVSVGNVSKVKQLMLNAHAEVLQALRSGEISIHRASLWMKEPPQKQYEMLRSHQSERGIRNTIRTLISRHKLKGSSVVVGVEGLLKRLSALTPDELSTINLFIAKEPGNAIFLTEELAQALESQEGLAFT
jgi:hypothetical protein